MTQLIALPVRLWLRGARAAVHTAEDVTGAAMTLTLRAVGTLSSLRGGARRTPTAPTPPPEGPPRADGAPDPDRAAEPAGPPRADRAAKPDSRANGASAPPAPEQLPPLASERLEREGIVAPADLDAPAPEALGGPDHVSTEAVLVREDAEPGAEEGAGAAVHVEPPWKSYGGMSARDVVARLRGASSAELAAVQLYETANRNRQTVLQAVARELKSANR